MDDDAMRAHRAADDRVQTTSAAVERIEQRNRRLGRLRLGAFIAWLALISVGLAVFMYTVISKQGRAQHQSIKQGQEILRIEAADERALQILQQATGPSATKAGQANQRQAILCIDAYTSHVLRGTPMPAGCPSP